MVRTSRRIRSLRSSKALRTSVHFDGGGFNQTIGGGSPWAVRLIFLGPLGWMFLIASLVFGGRSRQLLVRIPYSQRGLHRERSEFRAAVVSGAAMVASAIAMVIALAGPTPRSQVRETVVFLLVGATLLAAVATVALGIRYSLHRPGIELDASGRWVTLLSVHPNFARAVADRTVRESVDRW